jgi:hypothetical protein
MERVSLQNKYAVIQPFIAEKNWKQKQRRSENNT